MTAPTVAAKIDELRKEIAAKQAKGQDVQQLQEDLAYLELTSS